MAVKVRCPECEKVLTVPDTARGKSVKCPGCEAKVPVPSGTSKAAEKSAKAKAPAPDSEDALASLDLRNAEDANARICPKCGYDMTYYDEESTECPKCGTDIETGGLGAKAAKKKRGGPDFERFYETIWSPQWKFVFRHQSLGWRTMLYVLIASNLMFGSLFLYFYIPPWPPRLFFLLIAIICGLMMPGWLWFLDQEIIKGTLERKDKLKRINFDFFLCTALGVKTLIWHALVALPLLIVPLLVGALLAKVGGLPSYVTAIAGGLGYFFVLPFLAIGMGHMVMPIQEPGFMVWKLAPGWFKTFGPTTLSTVIVVSLMLPSIACVVAAGAVWGAQIEAMARTTDENSAIWRAKTEYENAGKNDKPKLEKADEKLGRLKAQSQPVDYSPLLVPGILWNVACLLMAFPAVYAMRVNGQLIAQFREYFDLQALTREYKYVATERREGDEEAPEKTDQALIIEAVMITGICAVVGAAMGLAIGLNLESGMVVGALTGIMYGISFANSIGGFSMISEAFKVSTGWGLLVMLVPFGVFAFLIQYWRKARGPFYISIVSSFMMMVYVILMIAGIITLAPVDEKDLLAPPAPQAPAQPLPAAAILPLHIGQHAV